MALDVSLLRESFALVAEREPQLMRRFYEILFTRYPRAKALFHRNSSAQQERMLTQALVAVLDRLEDASWLQSNLAVMGARHASYGVTPEMYDWVGDSLLATLEEVAGEAWTPALAKAWADAYGAIRDLMLAGVEAHPSAEQPQGAPVRR